ncbi:baseplate protein [bacterium]|nr:baseplate protein [bacterium]
MALPMNKAPLYNVTIPSTKKEIKFRPFLVKEEKALLLAQQSEDPKVMINTLKSIIENCVVDKIDINSLAIFDYEYLFTQIRAKSVGEIVELIFLCDTCDDDKAKTQVNLDISKFEVDFPEGHDNKIPLFDDVGIIMKNPTLETLDKLEKIKDGDVNSIFDAVADCMESVYNTEEVFNTKDQTKQEVLDFLENLTQEQFKKIENFFLTMPKLHQTVEYDCPVCNKHHVKSMEGLASFF